MAGNIVVIIAMLGVTRAMAQDYSYVDIAKSKDVPKHFEASGPDAIKTISAYVSAIEKVAEITNSIATFNVQVTMERKHKTKHGHVLPTKAKRFKVPLKKKLRLSSFELDLRKHASYNNEKKMDDLENAYSDTTTEKSIIVVVTKKNRVGKYKPYITGMKPKYVKYVKPVSNKEIVVNLP